MNLEEVLEIFANLVEENKKKQKEFLYVGHYIDECGRYILKIGTTNNLTRRRYEHNRNYRKSNGEARMPREQMFEYDWHIRLSPANTLNYESLNKKLWQALRFGEYLDNDRFIFKEKPELVYIMIKKSYKIVL